MEHCMGPEEDEWPTPMVMRSFPWLVFSNDSTLKMCSVLDPTMSFDKLMDDLIDKHIVGGSQGWLILYDDSYGRYNHYSLFDPLSHCFIKLPDLEDEFEELDFVFYLLSSPPTDPNCTVFFFDSNYYRIYFCKLYNDKEWHIHDYQKELLCMLGKSQYYGEMFSCVFAYNGKLYGETYDHKRIVMIEEVDKRLKLTTLEFRVRDSKLHNAVKLKSYLVESMGDIFHVTTAYRGFNCQDIQTIKIQRLDFDENSWVEVKSLPDRSIFLGRKEGFSCSTTEYGVEGGVYFFDDEEEIVRFHFYNIEENSITSYPLPCTPDELPTDGDSPIWIMPSGFTLESVRTTRTEMGCNREEHEVKANKNVAADSSKRINNLDPDILRLIGKHLTTNPSDYIHFRACCKSFKTVSPPIKWRSIISTFCGSEQSKLEIYPWLMFLKRNVDNACNFVDSIHGDNYLSTLPESLVGASICFAKGGWLLMSEDMRYFYLFNPFTKETVGPYPPLPGASGILTFSFSGLPSSSNCVLIITTKNFLNEIVAYFIYPGGTVWWGVELKHRYFVPQNGAVFLDDRFYYLGECGELAILEIPETEDLAFESDLHDMAIDVNEEEEEEQGEEVEELYKLEVLSQPQKPCDGFQSCHLAECDGELLSIYVGDMGKWIKIFWLDRSSMVWVKVNKIKNYMVFVSNLFCFSIEVKKSPELSNRIYFPRVYGQAGVVFYSLDTGRFNCQKGLASITMDDFYGTREFKGSGWILPTR